MNLSFPTFDLCWLSVTNANAPVLLIPGVGGINGEGIDTHGIQIANVKASRIDLHKYLSFDLPGNMPGRVICTGVMLGCTVVCMCVGKKCALFVANNSRTGINLSPILEFDGDFGPKSSQINSCVITNNGMLITGGDDAICRIWHPQMNTGSWSVIMVAELRGHDAAITGLNLHPFDDFLCSCSADGFVKIWSLKTNRLIGDNPPIAISSKDEDGGVKTDHEYQCYGCSFSSDGGHLFTLQFDGSSNSYLVKWTIANSIPGGQSLEEHLVQTAARTSPPFNGTGRGNISIELAPIAVGIVKDTRACRLSVSNNGEHVAVGCTNGTVHVFPEESLEKPQVHQLFDGSVTGMVFAVLPDSAVNAEALACASSTKLAVLSVGGLSTTFKVIFCGLCFLLVAFLALLFVLVVYEEFSISFISAILEYGSDLKGEL